MTVTAVRFTSCQGRSHDKIKSTRSRTHLLSGLRVPKTTRQRSVSWQKPASAGCRGKERDLSQFARRMVVARQLRKQARGPHARILLAVCFLSPRERQLDRRGSAVGAYGYIYWDPGESRQSRQTTGWSGETQRTTSALFSPSRETLRSRRSSRRTHSSELSPLLSLYFNQPLLILPPALDTTDLFTKPPSQNCSKSEAAKPACRRFSRKPGRLGTTP